MTFKLASFLTGAFLLILIALPQAKAEVGPSAGYKKGFFLHSGDGNYAMHMKVVGQGRYTLEVPDNGEEESAFSLSRIRLTLAGHAHSKSIRYKFQTDFGKGQVSLKDFLVDYTISQPVVLRVGQFKRPFSRQQITSSSKQAFIDRAITDKSFGAGRDIGIAFHNNYEKSPQLEWAVGIFNGTGDKGRLSGSVDTATGDIETGSFNNVPGRFNPAFVARIGYNSPGMKGYSEADLEGGPLRFAVAASSLVVFDADKGKFDADDADNASVAIELDYALKVNGLSTDGAIYLVTAQDGSSLSDLGYAGFGAHLQAGYLVNETYLPTIRYALVVPDGSDNNRHEIMGGLALFAHGHKFKWQIDGGVLLNETAGETQADILARTQLQLAF